MSGIELQGVERILSDVAFEVHDRASERQHERFLSGLAEYTEEWHIAITGHVNDSFEMVTANATIEFAMDFFLGVEQRRSDLASPTFHAGSFQPLTVGEGEEEEANNFVVVTAAVREWTMRDDKAFIGCVVTIGVHVPYASGPTPFDALVHLSFSGWGAPHDAEVNETDPTP